MTRFSLSAVGADRPGIVAAVSGALEDAGCNLEDSTMAILRGQFAMVLVVSAPPGTSAEDLERRLDDVAQRLGLVVVVRPLHEAEGGGAGAQEGGPAAGGAVEPGPVSAWTIAVHGADHPGIVHAVTEALAAGGGNVVDLVTHLVGEPDAPVYVLTIRATLPAERAEEVADAVRRAATAVGVHCTLRPDESDLL